jgi:F0F1-type ATP synthase delta subunit
MLYKVEPAIIGGISIVLGNQIIDDSIRYHLAQLKDVMLGLEVY